MNVEVARIVSVCTLCGGLLALACEPSTGAAPPATPPAPSAVASVAPPLTSSAPPVVALPPPPPCSEVVKRIPFGKTLEERSEELKGLPPGEQGALTELFPSIKAEGFLVETALGIQLGEDTTARALVLHRPLEEGQRSFGPRPAWLGLASCTQDRGYALLARPMDLNEPAAVLVWDTERVQLPGGTTATMVTLAMGGIALEFHAAAFVLGQGSPAFPVQDPAKEKFGSLGAFGNVAQQFLIPGPGENYARADRAGGTGLYPLGDRMAFVSLQVSQGARRGVVQGWIGADGVKPRGMTSSTSWAAVGKGEPPAFCAQAGKVRCAKLEIPSSEGKLAQDWIAGVWPSAEAAEAALKGLGADPKKLDFLLLDADGDADPPRGPNGRAALTFLKAKPPKKVLRK
jgi:hypothetical protein